MYDENSGKFEYTERLYKNIGIKFSDVINHLKKHFYVPCRNQSESKNYWHISGSFKLSQLSG